MGSAVAATLLNSAQATNTGIRFTVLVSSYNYRDYVVDAVQSAVDQSWPPHEVIVVDDGSTDDSVHRLEAHFAHTPAVRIVRQANAGQLAAWMTGFALSSGDVVALLDSDDLWEPHYLATMAQAYQRHPSADYVYCNMSLFGAREGVMLHRRRDRQDRDLGTSVLLGCFHPRWQGVATSGNTLRRELMARILTLPADQVSQWKTRPDDCLFYGADILGARKIYLATALARHREHTHNALLADQRSAARRQQYKMRRQLMLEYYRQLAHAGPALLAEAAAEFRTKSHPTAKECWLYLRMAASAPQSWGLRWAQIREITRHFLLHSTSR